MPHVDLQNGSFGGDYELLKEPACVRQLFAQFADYD